MHDFDYRLPTSLSEAVELLAENQGRARPFAGGTDLIDQMRHGRHEPDVLVDIKRLAELNVLEANGDGLRLGAAVPCFRVYGSAEVREQYSALADCAHIIGGIQIQSRASLGGNLCNAGPAADSTPAMIALGGLCTIAGPEGQRQIPVEEFCVGPGSNVLGSGELLVEIRFAASAANSGSHYRRMIPRNEMDIAVVGVGASVQLDDSKQNIVAARIGLGAVAPTPLLAQEAGQALAGQPATPDAFEKAAKAAREIVNPITDMRGTADYRRHVTGVLVKRVLQAAVERARGEEPSYCPGR